MEHTYPFSEPESISPLRRSPALKWVKPKCSTMYAHCVPFPLPGPPVHNNIKKKNEKTSLNFMSSRKKMWDGAVLVTQNLFQAKIQKTIQEKPPSPWNSGKKNKRSYSKRKLFREPPINTNEFEISNDWNLNQARRSYTLILYEIFLKCYCYTYLTQTQL